MPELVIPEDLKQRFDRVCKIISLQGNVPCCTAEKEKNFIERIAQAEQALTEERQHADELAKALQEIVDDLPDGCCAEDTCGGDCNVRARADKELADHAARRKQEDVVRRPETSA